MDTDFNIYEDKTFKDLCKDIYSNQSNRKEQIELLISDLKPLIKTTNDAMMLVPLIKEYIDSGISNDEHLIKLAQIIQRIISVESSAQEKGSSFGISEEEKKSLMDEINSIKDSGSSIVVKNITK